eukprot:812377-Lingulodinium_polyedra.AAC.1
MPDAFASADEATEAWQKVVTCVEDEVLAACDIHGGEAAPYRGLAAEPRWVLREVVWRRRRNEAPATFEVRAYRWIATRL